MKKSLFLLFLLSAFLTSAQEFTQDTKKTKVTFKIKNFGVNVDGDFSQIDIRTNFNSNNLDESYIHATIAVISIDTGIESRDEHILEEDYFDEPNHKNITLKSTKITKKANGTYSMTANLTIKGITRRLEIPINFQETNDSIMIQSNFEINRRDFNVGGGSFIMSKKVKIQVEYTGTK